VRYYEITLTPTKFSSPFAPVVFSTLAPNRVNNGSALQVDLDIYQAYFHKSGALASINIHGVDFSDLNQGANWNGANITVAVGMSSGLPFANQSQAGIIINGTVFQEFGNWQGNDVSLNLLVLSSTINPDESVNLSFNWKKGDMLGNAIQETLHTAYPTMLFKLSTSPNLVFTEDQPAQYTTLRPFAEKMNLISKQLNPDPNYQGVSISAQIGGFVITDGSQPAQKITTINFTDLIGNLTWIDVATLQAKVVMRGDLEIGNGITFPVGAPTTSLATSYGQLRNLVSFDGVFRINQIRHVGSSRQPDASAWVTIIDCIIPGALTPTN